MESYCTVLLSKFGVVRGRRWEIWGKYDSGRFSPPSKSFRSRVLVRVRAFLLACLSEFTDVAGVCEPLFKLPE